MSRNVTKFSDRKSSNGVAVDGTFRSLVLTIGAFKRVMEPYFATFGIGGAQWGVLRTLHRAQLDGAQSLRLTDLSDRLVIKPPSVTEVVNRLQRMGLVRRADVVGDQRAKHVCLTAAGRKLVKRVLKRFFADLGRVGEQLPELLDLFLDRLVMFRFGRG